AGLAHLKVIAASSGLPHRRAWEVLEAVGMTQAAHRRIGGYSLGMKQRLGLAAALLGKPRNIVLDEPMNGLDPQGMEWMRTFLREAAASGHAVLVSSHLLGEMETLADRLLVIDHGGSIGQWDAADLLQARSRQALVRTDDDERLKQALRRLRVPVTRSEEHTSELQSRSLHDALPISPQAAMPSSSPPTCSARWRPSPIVSSSSTTAARSASGTPPTSCRREAAKHSSAPTTTSASSRLCADCGCP